MDGRARRRRREDGEALAEPADRLADPGHGAALFLGRGGKHNPVLSLRASGLLGVDVDGEAGRTLVRELVPGLLPPTVVVISGRADGGHHLWYRPPYDGADAKIEFSGDGLKLSSDGYLVIPPAVHGETGKAYEFASGHAPWEHEIAVIPESIIRSLEANHRRHDDAERADDSGPIAPGDRHRHLHRLGCAMRRVGAGEKTIAAALLAENVARCAPPKDEHLVLALAKDITARYRPGART